MRDSSVEMLQSYLTTIIESIVGSVDQCPPVMRVAFKQLHKRVEEQFAEPEHEVRLSKTHKKKQQHFLMINCLISVLPLQLLISFLQDVKYLAISGFFFLRFFAPAILTPKLFQLRDQHADTRTSRTLLLLAKVRFTMQTNVHTM